jgi:cyclopropane fatty-acyl-phospholipid synthase-like methyltransferase
MDYTNQVLKLINGYKISNVLFIASELNLFDYLDGKRRVPEIASNLLIHPKALEIVLDLFAAVGLVKKREKELYFMDEDIRPLLVSDSKSSFMPLIKLENYLSDKHTTKNILREVILHGKGCDLFNQNSKENQEEIYGQAMDHGSQYSSICTARELLSIKNGRVLDIGSGAGTYSIQLCKINKHVEVDMLDKPEMEKECRKNIAENNLGNRIKFYPGDICDYCFNNQYDGIILSNVLHLFDEDANKGIIKKISSILKEKGILVLHDFFLADDKTSPPVPSLFTLDWLMHGAFFNASIKDISDLVEEFGLKVIKVRHYENIPTSIIVVQK